MADVFNYGQKGVSDDVEFGKDGGRQTWDGSKFNDFENDGSTPARRAVADPVDPLDSVNFRTVEGLLQGIVWKESARLCTDSQLVGWISAGSGVGKTLTSPNDNVSNNDFDGVTAAPGDRILVNDGPTAVDNGIYVMTTLADGAGQAAILTRAEDFDQDVNAAGEDEVRPGATVFVSEGTVCTGNQYTVLGTGPITVDTNAINWTLTGSINANDPLIRVATIGTGALQNLGPPLPVGARVQRVKLTVTTQYGGGIDIEIQDDGPTVYMDLTENNPNKLGTYLSEQPGDVVVGGTRQLQATIAGAPGAGAATVVVEYKV